MAKTVANRMMDKLNPDFVFLYARGRRIPHTPISDSDVQQRRPGPVFQCLGKFPRIPADAGQAQGTGIYG